MLRIDYPLEWPGALPDLLGLIRDARAAKAGQLKQALLMLHQAVKELATARLARSQTSLRSIAPEIVSLLVEIYTQHVAIWLGIVQQPDAFNDETLLALEISLSSLKILRRLLIAGFEMPHKSTEVTQIWLISQQHFQQFLLIYQQQTFHALPTAGDLNQKHILQLAKLHVDMVNAHPAAFALLPQTVELVQAYWGLITNFGETYAAMGLESVGDTTTQNASTDTTSTIERLAIKGLVVLRACIKMVHSPAHTFKYRTPEVKVEQRGAQEHLRSKLLLDNLIIEVARVVVTKFFVFRQVDMQAWEEKEDEWDATGSDTWEFEIRPCAEKLFCDLVIYYKHLLIEPLLQFFQSVADSTQHDLIQKDAVYTAMGLAAPVVFEHFDFDHFLTTTLVSDISYQGAAGKVLRRRIAILVAKWVTIRISDANRPLVLQLYSHLLNPDDLSNDIVVRVTAARELKVVVDDIAFDAQAFLPYANEILARLRGLIQAVDSTETRLTILETIRAIATRLDQEIVPFADDIVSMLPGLWEASGEEHLIKQAILTLMSTITSTMRDQAVRYHGLMLPLIRRAVEPGSDIQVYLLEEALDLWSVVLAQVVAPASPEIIALLECAFPLLELASENLRVVLLVLDSYALLTPETMLRDEIRVRILSHMTDLLGVSKRELCGMVISIVEKLIRAAHDLGGSDGLSILCRDLKQTGFLEKIMLGLEDAWQAHETVGPDRRYPKLDDVVETDYFTIVSRIAVADPIVCWTVLGAFGDASSVWKWLAAEWFRHFDCMANADRQKLSCLAITRMLELPPPVLPAVLAKLQDYFAMWTAVVSELMAGRDDGGDNLIWTTSEGSEFEAPEDVRRRLHAAADVVHKVHSLEFVMQRLATAVQSCGGEDAFHQSWLVNVDGDVLTGFQNVRKADGTNSFMN